MTFLPAARGVSRRVRILAAVFFAAAALALWETARPLMGQMLFALLLTALAMPTARRLEKRMNRNAAALLSVIGLVGAVLGVAWLLMPPLISQISRLIAQAPQLLEDLQRTILEISQREWAKMLGVSESALREELAGAAKWALNSLPQVVQGIGAGLNALSKAFLSPVLAFYFVRDWDMFSYRLSLLIPLRHRKRALTAWQEMRREAGGYVRGQAMIAALVSAMTALGLLITGIPAWLALGLLMGLCEFIPYIGPLIGGVPIALAALPMGWGTALWALGVTAAVQQIESYFLSPRLMAGATGLHPVGVLALLSVGGSIAGLLGMVAAVPLFVCVRGAVRVLYETRKEAEGGG